MPLIAKLLGSALLIYAALLAALWFMQGRLIHLPHVPGRTLEATPASVGLDYEEVRIATSDGERLHGWFLPAPEPRGTVLFLHGNAGNISHRLDTLSLLRALDVQVLIIDYRGYGESTGSPGEAGLYRDALAAWEHLVEVRNIPPDRLIALGRSLGGAVAAQLAAERPVAGLVVEAAFTSMADLAARQYPMFPVRPLLRHRYDTEAALERVRQPVLVVHGRDDTLVPPEHGRQLHATAPNAADWVLLDGGHDDAFHVSREDYRAALDRFLATVLPDPDGGAPDRR